MPLHRASGNWRSGFLLSIITVSLWGVLPTALAIALQGLDPYTTIWFRFLLSFLAMAGLVALRYRWHGKPMGLPHLTWIDLSLLMIATAGVGLEYLFYLQGLTRTSPANAEVLVQLSPLMVSLGAIVLFGERYSWKQWGGVALLALGFILFYNEKLKVVLTTPAQYQVGSGLIVLAAIAWAAYALAQKQLLQKMAPDVIMLVIYAICALVFSPFAVPQRVLTLNGLHFSMLLFCSLNTLVAYWTFAASLEHWEASRVSALLSLTPVITLASVTLVAHFKPDLMEPERLTIVGGAGAVLVVVGSMVVTVGKRKAVEG